MNDGILSDSPDAFPNRVIILKITMRVCNVSNMNKYALWYRTRIIAGFRGELHTDIIRCHRFETQGLET